MKKSITNTINEINKLIPEIQNMNFYVTTYDNGTFPYYIILTDLIKVKNQFVYIAEDKSQHAYNFEKRYNTNNEHQEEELIYHLRLIKREFKKAIKKGY
jgi:hypothetical protein